jgi:hypothetical protein
VAAPVAVEIVAATAVEIAVEIAVVVVVEIAVVTVAEIGVAAATVDAGGANGLLPALFRLATTAIPYKNGIYSE